MSITVSIKDFSKYLFWDVDATTVTIDKSKNFLIPRIIEYGQMSDWNMLKQAYGLAEIRTAMMNARSIDEVTLSFLCVILDEKIENFRCYKLKPYRPVFGRF